MRFFFNSVLIIIFLSSTILSQQPARRQKLDELKQINEQLKILRAERQRITSDQVDAILRLKSVSEQDKSDAEKLGAKAIRLFPCCELEEFVSEMDELTFTDRFIRDKSPMDLLNLSRYQIADLLIDENSRNSYESPETLEYSENSLSFIASRNGNHGFMRDLGKTSFEDVGEQTKETVALAAYEPPTDEKSIKKELVSNNLTFGQTVPVTVGNTYILRVVKYSTTPLSLDGIFAVKVKRIEKDGSIILFIKAVKMFDAPKLNDPDMEEFYRVLNLGLVVKIKEELRAKGFKSIDVEVIDKVVTLKGSVPVGKSAEAVEIAKSVYSNLTIKNELVEN